MDNAAQNKAIAEIVDLDKVTLVAGDVLRPLSIVDALRSHYISRIVHTAANPLLTVGAQKEPYSAINPHGGCAEGALFGDKPQHYGHC